MGFKCNPPALPVGITVVASEEVLVPGFVPEIFPVPNAPDRGELVSLAVEPNTGNRGSFVGKTNEFGIDNHPEAVTNGTWEVCVGPTASPPCFEGCITQHVPAIGGVFQLFCVV
jgi:hypothetical protein